MLRKDGIDLTASRVLIVEDQPCGIALIARRGLDQPAGGDGHRQGNARQRRRLMVHGALIREARQRGDHEMVLEVIEQNEPAVKLYRRSGFQTVRRLIGFTRRGKDAQENEESSLHKVDLHEMGRLVSQHGLADLPWQLSGESIAQLNPPACAYRNGQAYLVVSNPEAEHVVIWSLLVEPEARARAWHRYPQKRHRSIRAKHGTCLRSSLRNSERFLKKPVSKKKSCRSGR